MNVKKATAGILLLFVAAAVITLAVKMGRRATSTQPTESPPVVPAPKTESTLEELSDGVIVYCFHAKFRCPTCYRIEDLAYRTLTDRFAAELEAGEIVWKVVNYEEPDNQHFIDEYNLVAPTVVVVGRKDGKTIRWDNLMKVWKLVHDAEAFSEYVGGTVEETLKDVRTWDARSDVGSRSLPGPDVRRLGVIGRCFRRPLPDASIRSHVKDHFLPTFCKSSGHLSQHRQLASGVTGAPLAHAASSPFRNAVCLAATRTST